MLRHWSIIKLSCLKMCYCMLLCKQLQHEANLARVAADAERARANQAKNEAAAAEQAKAAAGFAAAEKEAEDELKKATEKVSETFAATSNASAAADGDKQAGKSEEPARDHGSREEGFNASSEPFAFGAQDETEQNYPSKQHSTRAKSKQAAAAKVQRQNKSAQDQKDRKAARMDGARHRKNGGKGA